MTTKRAYKLRILCHTNCYYNVCLYADGLIGRKSSRVLVTGGEDHKVNLWAIGKPNAILSLSGHTSGIDSVCFDSSEVLLAAGAANGTIKLWDLEEAKIVRTFTGHRSNCISVDFHPFGEFFGSGSLDTNLKIWDIRKKSCIHTYKGHTRGVSAIRFSPDGRWVVSGGEDNTVKIWDLTAGKLLHEFKNHEGQIQCIDFHPHEFLLATGAADRTVKFWDLETFELIGSAGPETSGVQCLTFNPDGRTLFCGLQESLNVFSWEPIRCHHSVDVGWSKLADLNVHEGKLIGCSFNQSCVGVWVVDISQTESNAIGNATRFNVQSESKSYSAENLSLLNENSVKASLGRLSVSQNSDPPLVKETKSLGRSMVSQNSESVKESKVTPTGSVPAGTPQELNMNTGQNTFLANSVVVPNPTTSKSNSTKVNSTANTTMLNKSSIMPVIVPRTDARLQQLTESRKEVSLAERTMPFSLQSRTANFRKFASDRDDVDRPQSESLDSKEPESSNVGDRNVFPSVKSLIHPGVERKTKDDRCSVVLGRNETNPMAAPPARFRDDYGMYSNSQMIFVGIRNEVLTLLMNHEIVVSDETQQHESSRDIYSLDSKIQRGGRTRLAINWEKRGRSNHEAPTSTILHDAPPVTRTLALNSSRYRQRGHPSYVEKETVSSSDEDVISDLMEKHNQFVSSMHSRFAKLQAVYRYWRSNDIKGAIGAMEKMADYAIFADVMSIVNEKMDIVTLDICTCLLPLLTGLLGSDMDRHISIGLEMLLKLVRTFGSMIYSALSARASVGVDIEAEQRLERYKLCYVEFEKVKQCLPALTRRGGSVAKSAQELNLALQEVP
ncbi:hypothetical protein ACFE04_031080 [Oxalis oulophora]